MSGFVYLALLVFLIIAIVLGEGGTFVLPVIYMLLLAIILSRLWSRRAISTIKVSRKLASHAFLGESIQVSLKIGNQGSLPIPWLYIHESLPSELRAYEDIDNVISLGRKQTSPLEYKLEGRKRGFYPIGPLKAFTGDILGISKHHYLEYPPDYITIYPKIIPLRNIPIPSYSPMGTLRHKQPIFEDPSRVLGKRDYIYGDSMRRVDWKATAATSRLQVKLFEPSIALDTVLFLNLYSPDYPIRARYDVMELAVVIAASIASWVIGVRQSVGLVTNAIDPKLGEMVPPTILPRRGRGQLLRVLEVLARVQTADTYPLADMIHRECVNLSWGTTIILITHLCDDVVFDAMFYARRKGIESILVLCGLVRTFKEIESKAISFGFPIFNIQNEHDLDIWRR